MGKLRRRGESFYSMNQLPFQKQQSKRIRLLAALGTTGSLFCLSRGVFCE
jgi:hypothetical protein